MKMALKAKKEAPVPPKAKAKAKALRAKKYWKGSIATKTEDLDITHLLAAHTVANIQGSPISSEERP